MTTENNTDQKPTSKPTTAPVVIGCSDLLGKLVVDESMPILSVPHIVVGVEGTKKALAVCGKTGAGDHKESLMNANIISNIPEMMELVKAVAHIGLDWGYGEFKLTDDHIKKSKSIIRGKYDRLTLELTDEDQTRKRLILVGVQRFVRSIFLNHQRKILREPFCVWVHK